MLGGGLTWGDTPFFLECKQAAANRMGGPAGNNTRLAYLVTKVRRVLLPPTLTTLLAKSLTLPL